MFYSEYFDLDTEKVTEYKIKYLKSIITDNHIYKFISFDDNRDLNTSKLSSLREKNLWFRQLTSKYIDNHEIKKRVELIEILRDSCNGEINNLILKCQRLAQDFGGQNDPTKLSNHISRYIKLNVEKEINDLLKLKRYQFNELFDDLFSDEKTWIAISSTVVSIFWGGSPLLSAGTALAAFSSIAAKSFKVAAGMDKKVKNSDYALIYLMSNAK